VHSDLTFQFVVSPLPVVDKRWVPIRLLRPSQSSDVCFAFVFDNLPSLIRVISHDEIQLSVGGGWAPISK
jgi:hypothetical protein